MRHPAGRRIPLHQNDGSHSLKKLLSPFVVTHQGITPES
jgi:hypothetical protein